MTFLSDRFAALPKISAKCLLMGIATMALLGASGIGVMAPASAAPLNAHAENAHLQLLPSSAVGAGSGYWLVASDGGIFTHGAAGYFGSQGATPLNKPIVGMAATPDAQGYWLVASDGGIFAHGDAVFHGSTGGIALNKPIVGMAATHDGGGYWMVASDGGIFAFGDAGFYGSTGGIALNKPIVGMAATSDGRGYWMVASDGGIFAFGDAAFHGSTGGIALNKPIVGMAATSDDGGYWLVASDGGIFAFGDAGYYGSQGATPLNKPIVGMAATPDGLGYWLVASDGGIFTHGDAGYYGSQGATPLNKPIVGMAVDPFSAGTQITPAGEDHNEINQISCATPAWCMAVDQTGNAYVYSNGVWSGPKLIAADGFGPGGGISCPTTKFCMAVSYIDGVATYNGTSWTAMAEPAGDSNASFDGVSCSSATLCVAANLHGGTAGFYNAGTWSYKSGKPGLSTTEGVPNISCALATETCMAVDAQGRAYAETANNTTWSAVASTGVDPNPGGTDTAVACLTNGKCVVIDTNGYAGLGKTGGTWTQYGAIDPTTSSSLQSVTCDPTSTICVAVDEGGNALILNVAAGTWTAPEAFDSEGESTTVSCPSTTFCMAGDTSGFVYAFNPTS